MRPLRPGLDLGLSLSLSHACPRPLNYHRAWYLRQNSPRYIYLNKNVSVEFQWRVCRRLRPFACPSKVDGRDEESRERPSRQARGPSLLPASLGFYSALTLLSFGLGHKYDVLGQLLAPMELLTCWQLELTLVIGWLKYLAALIAMLTTSTVLTEMVPSFRKMKVILQDLLIPELQSIPVWGLGLMAIAAGIGEECFFRGCIQTWLVETAHSSLKCYLSENFATFIGVFTCSILFGTAHSITMSYFLFASIAGGLFGLEYLECGLPAVALTHGLYDFVAFIALTRMWGESRSDSGKM